MSTTLKINHLWKVPSVTRVTTECPGINLKAAGIVQSKKQEIPSKLKKIPVKNCCTQRPLKPFKKSTPNKPDNENSKTTLFKRASILEEDEEDDFENEDFNENGGSNASGSNIGGSESDASTQKDLEPDEEDDGGSSSGGGDTQDNGDSQDELAIIIEEILGDNDDDEDAIAEDDGGDDEDEDADAEAAEQANAEEENMRNNGMEEGHDAENARLHEGGEGEEGGGEHENSDASEFEFRMDLIGHYLGRNTVFDTCDEECGRFSVYDETRYDITAEIIEEIEDDNRVVNDY